ncbi:hypothetical protein CR162_04530 [Pseudoroseomonas rhizosphaerae]|uniref:DUF4214 domain-containing protein n=2 Tax=Teichococcus rhizosphaerae TaxID=1335062 RepID=A0A2C6Y5M7_9PROT|nr:hypothetical protein CR162_04530 [Pseudoroseomonas rhizosphaerae]
MAAPALLNSLKLVWQAEHTSIPAGGAAQTSLTSGGLLWLSAEDRQRLQSGLAQFEPPADAAYRLDFGGNGEERKMLVWVAAAEPEAELSGLLQGLLGQREKLEQLSLPAGGQLLDALHALAGEAPAPPVSLTLEVLAPLSPAAGLFGPLQPKAVIAVLYDAVLDRAPSRPDMAYWIGHGGGGPLDARQVAQALLESPEFLARHGGASDRDFVAGLYRNTHDQDPSPAILDHWTEMLGSHALDRTELVLRMALLSEEDFVLR